MGLFSMLKSIAGKALEVVGEKIPGPIGDKLQDIGWDLQYGKTGLSASSSLQETFDAAAECLKNCNAAMDKAAPLIHEIVEIAKKRVDDCNFELISLIPEEQQSAVGYHAPDDLFANIENEYRQYIGSKISLDNKEYKEKLAIKVDSERQKTCSAYADQVLKEAVKRTETAVHAETNRAVDAMITALEEYANVQETQAKHSQELLDGLKAKAENPDFIVNQSWKKIIDIAYIENIRSLAYESIQLLIN